MHKCPKEHKLSGVYLINAICHAAKGKKEYTSLIQRFESKLPNLFDGIAAAKLSDKDKEKIKKTASLWIKNGLLNESVMRDISKKHADLLDFNYVATAATADKNDDSPTGPSANKSGSSATAASPSKEKESSAKGPNPLEFDYEDSDEEEGAPRKRKMPSATIASIPLISTVMAPIPAAGVNHSGPNSAQSPIGLAPSVSMLASLVGMTTNQFPLNSLLQSVSTPGNAINLQPLMAYSTVPIKQQRVDGQLSVSHNAGSYDPGSMQRIKLFDEFIGLDQVKVMSRTLFVGGVSSNISPEMIYDLFAKYGAESVRVNYDKFTAFVKLNTRDNAETAKNELGAARVALEGQQLRVNWACGFGPRESFDRKTGISLINVSHLSEQDCKWLEVELGPEFLQAHREVLRKRDSTFTGGTPFCFGALRVEEPTGVLYKSKNDNIEFFVPEGSSVKIEGGNDQNESAGARASGVVKDPRIAN